MTRLVKRLQRALREEKVSFGSADELDEMSKILERLPGIKRVYQAVLKEVTGKEGKSKGREGLSVTTL